MLSLAIDFYIIPAVQHHCTHTDHMCLLAMISDPELIVCLSISDVSIKILYIFETVTDVLNNDSIDEDVPSKKNKLEDNKEIQNQDNFSWLGQQNLSGIVVS